MKLALFTLIALAPLASLWAQGIERTAGLPTNGADAALWQSLQNNLQALRSEVSALRQQHQQQAQEQVALRELLGVSLTAVSGTVAGAALTSPTSGMGPSSSMVTSFEAVLKNCRAGEFVQMGPSNTLVCGDNPMKPNYDQWVPGSGCQRIVTITHNLNTTSFRLVAISGDSTNNGAAGIQGMDYWFNGAPNPSGTAGWSYYFVPVDNNTARLYIGDTDSSNCVTRLRLWK